ncbi:hypothetical protein L211DRAFT_865764 [Terfezia boudieri ATCC MYA-4762]|uniref:Uncharacterized protein n=1 Tax=Terfezia boudieri ATCC MYA-4762 TaxID=1051890 RepID=A0A3N4LXL3_9PEZI|nr:hypothetical protein L211DRAFT_865764 [Terfezia boudieri ATCC MYA-4762]
MDHIASRLTTSLPNHDAIGFNQGPHLFRSRPNQLIKTSDLHDDDNNELDIIESYRFDSNLGSVFTLSNSMLPRHFQYSSRSSLSSWSSLRSRSSLSSARSSTATFAIFPLDSGLGTAVNSSRSSTIPTTVPPTPAKTVPPSEHVNQFPVLPQEYTDAWLESQLAKAEQGLCGLRTELIFYYQRKIMKENTVQNMKELYEDRREGHTRAIAEYMTTGAVRPSGVQDTTATTQSGPQGMEAEAEGEDIGRGEVEEVEQVEEVEPVEEMEQIGEAKTNRAAEQTDKTVEQTNKTLEQTDKAIMLADKAVEEIDKAVEQIDKTTEPTDDSQPRKLKVPCASSPSTISIIETTPTLICAPLPINPPYIRCRKSPPPPPPIDNTELLPVPPPKSALRQLSVPFAVVPPTAANYHSKERCFTPTLGPPWLDTEASTGSSSSPRGPFPKTESPPVTTFQSVRMQLPVVPPRPAFIRGKTRNFTSPAMLQLPPGSVSDKETTTVGYSVSPLPTAEPPPAPPGQPVQQRLPIVPPRPAFIRGKIRNFTTPVPAPMTADESRRKVPTRLNKFSTLLETFSQGQAPITKQPNSKL